MDKANENRSDSGTASLISSGRDDAAPRPVVVRPVPVHVRAIRIGIAEVREIAIGIDVVFVSCHPRQRRCVHSSRRRRLMRHIMRALLPLVDIPAPA